MNAKQIARMRAVMKYDREGVLWLVGYDRKPSSRKSGTVWLKKPVKVKQDETNFKVKEGGKVKPQCKDCKFSKPSRFHSQVWCQRHRLFINNLNGGCGEFKPKRKAKRK